MGLTFEYEDGQTPLQEDEKEGLKVKSITTQEELNQLEQLNIEKAMEWTFSARIKPDKVLTKEFLKDLHKRMYNEVWNWAGIFRKSDKNIGIKWTNIEVQLTQLLNDAQYWVKHNSFSPEEIAIRFKHRLVSIHCFPNGNGRHSRLIADIIMERVFNQEPFSWHQSNMVKANETRKKYIIALKQADNGHIKPLLEFAKN